jgi:hypothetical protein
MNYQVKTIENGRGISLQSYRDHLSLYESDLKDLIFYNETEECFIRRVESWLWDIIGDEYDRDNFKYNDNDLERALKVVFKNLYNDFEQSAEFETKKAERLAELAKAELEKKVHQGAIADYVWKKQNFDRKCYCWSDFTCTKEYDAYYKMQEYIKAHLEEFAELSEDERNKKGNEIYLQKLKEIRGW